MIPDTGLVYIQDESERLPVPKATVNGITLHYEDEGRGDPVLLVHGLGTGSADWACQVPALASRYRVIAPCLRGFGQSERPEGPYSIGLFAEDLDALLDHLGIDRCHVCGISMGGAVSLQFAVDRPERLRSLVLINSQPSFEIDTLRKRMLVLSRTVLTRTLGLNREAAIQLRRNFPGRANRELREKLRGRFRNDIGPYMQSLKAIAGWTVADQVGGIAVPVLFIAAELDYTRPEEKAGYAAMFPDARLVTIAGARHAVHLERPGEVNDLLLEFLAS